MAISKKRLRKRSKRKKSKRKSTRKDRGKSKTKSRRKRKATRKDGVIPSTQTNEIQGGRPRSDWDELAAAREEYRRQNPEYARQRDDALLLAAEEFDAAIKERGKESDRRAQAMAKAQVMAKALAKANARARLRHWRNLNN
jgi:hypothetical protein